MDVKSRRCKHPGCVKAPSFSLPGSKLGEFCSVHKKEGMVDIKHGHCQHPGCVKQASFNIPGKKRGGFCSAHKKAGVGVVDARSRCQGNALPIGGIGGGSASRHPRLVPQEVGVKPVASGVVPPPRRSKAKVVPPPPQPRRSRAKVVPPPPLGSTAAVSCRKRHSERAQEQLPECPLLGSPPIRLVTWMVYNPYYSRGDVDPTLTPYSPAFPPFTSASSITRPSPTFVHHHHHQQPCHPEARGLLIIAAPQQQRQLSGRRASQQQQRQLS